MNQEIEVTESDIKKTLRIMMAITNVGSFAEIARTLDMNETTFRSSLDNSSLRLKDFVRIADLMGYKVVLTPQNIQK